MPGHLAELLDAMRFEAVVALLSVPFVVTRWLGQRWEVGHPSRGWVQRPPRPPDERALIVLSAEQEIDILFDITAVDELPAGFGADGCARDSTYTPCEMAFWLDVEDVAEPGA